MPNSYSRSPKQPVTKNFIEKKPNRFANSANSKDKLNGYCIRTGKPIPYNPKRPLSNDAYESWSQFSNPDYPEKYCHYSGEPSKGDTSFAKPILYKNWKKAKKMHPEE